MPSFILGRDNSGRTVLYKTPAVGFTLTSSDIEKKYIQENGEELVCSRVLGHISWTLAFKDDLLHRRSGPAVEHPDGTKSWYYYGEKINCSSQEEFEHLLKLKVFW